MNKAYLILQDGTSFEGYSFGSVNSVSAETVFNTSMTGFQEMLSDPDHNGQIVVTTFPSIGGTGVNAEDSLSDCSPVGVVVREYCPEPSNFRCERTLEDFMKERGIVGICGIDTRRLTRIIRDKGTMNGIITSDPGVTVESISDLPFCERYADGISAMKSRIASGEHVFAVGTEHLFLAAAMGCKVVKLQTGHRGSNQPVRDLRTGNICLTRQNHGWAVESVAEEVGEVILENVNDRTIEGIKYRNIPAMSVQFEPSPHGGPRNTMYLVEEAGKCR
jgi:carbamoylphosphate synthase small subunit